MGQGTLAHFTKCHSVYVISYDCSDKRWGLKQVLSEVNIGQVLKFYTLQPQMMMVCIYRKDKILPCSFFPLKNKNKVFPHSLFP